MLRSAPQPKESIVSTLIVAIALTGLALAQRTAAPEPELSVISARLGACAADFTVTEASGQPVYSATVHVRIRYGFLGVKRMDLEVGTNSDGKARVEGLPAKVRPLLYDVSKGDKTKTVEQDVANDCHATYAVTLR
jgi:hypothetical protein